MNSILHRRSGPALGLLAALPCLGYAASAYGQEDMPSVAESGPANVTDPAQSGSGGIRLSEDTVIHPSIEIASGYQTNVFYRDNQSSSGVPGTGLVRIGAGATISPIAPSQGGAQAADPNAAAARLDFSGNLNLQWNDYVATEDGNDIASDLGVGIITQVGMNPQSPLSFSVRDSFTRVVNPPRLVNAESLDRDKNELTLSLSYRPGGGALQGYATLSWMVDFFERSSSALPNRQSYIVAVGSRWQWLPMTQFNIEVNYGVVSTLGEQKGSPKTSSTPLRINAGAATLLTPTFGIVLRGGYGNAFYSSGPSYNSYLAQVEGRYSLSSTSRVAFGYERDFTDSVSANFYEDHALYGKLGIIMGGRWQVRGKAEMRLRTYEGVFDLELADGHPFEASSKTRNDLLVRLDAGTDYQINPWLNAGIDYAMSANNTEFFMIDKMPTTPGQDTDLAKFIWHELMARISGKY